MSPDLVQVVRVRLLRLLVRRRVIEDCDDLTLLPDAVADRDPALAQLANAAVHGLAPAGPERRQRPPIVLRGRPGADITGPLTATELGFSLHAATRCAADDARGREPLVRYILRPPLAQDRLELLPDGLVRITLKRPFADGTTAVDLDPLSLLFRLCAAVPPPRFNTIRYAGRPGPREPMACPRGASSTRAVSRQRAAAVRAADPPLALAPLAGAVEAQLRHRPALSELQTSR